MRINTVRAITHFFKEHIFVVVYFLFFVLASLPTIFNSFGKIEIFYKIGVLISLACVLLFIIIKRKIKINFRPIIFVASIFLIYSLYYLILPKYHSFIAPDFSFINGTAITFAINFNLRVSSIINIFNICFFIVLFVFISPSLGLTKKDFLVFYVLYFIFLFASCIYSVKDILNGLWSKDGLESFFQNKNTFGFFLMIGVFLSFLCTTFINKIYLKVMMYVIGLFFFTFSVISKSSTSAILSAFILIISAFYIISDSKVLNRLVKILIYSLIFLLVVVIVTSPLIPFLSSTYIGELVKGIYDKVSSIGKGDFESLFTSRGKMWMLGVYFIPSKYIFLGYGIPILEQMTYLSNVSYFTTSVLTNSYLTILDGLGIVGAIFYLSLFIFLFVIYFKDKSTISEWMLVLLIAYLVYGMFESLVLFRSGTNSLIFTPIIIVPAVVTAKKRFKISFFKIKVIPDEQ